MPDLAGQRHLQNTGAHLRPTALRAEGGLQLPLTHAATMVLGTLEADPFHGFWEMLMQHELLIAGVGALLTSLASLLTIRWLVMVVYPSWADVMSGRRFFSWRLFSVTYLMLTPMFVAILSFIQVWSGPKLWFVAFITSHIVEALGFWWFMGLLVSFLGENVEQQLQTLSKEEPCRIWAAKPLGCCVFGTMQPRTMGASDLLVFKILVAQLSVSHALLAIWDTIGVPQDLKTPLLIYHIASLLFGMYGIFAFQNAASTALQGRRATGKYWMMKGTILVSVITGAICTHVFSTEFGEVSLGNGAMLAGQASSALSAVLLAPLALLSYKCYTEEDATTRVYSKDAEDAALQT